MTAPDISVAERFGLNLKRSRRRAELSQQELAERASLTRHEIGLLEQGRRTARLGTAISLADGLGVEVDALLDGIRWIPVQRPRPSGFLVEPGPQFLMPKERPESPPCVASGPSPGGSPDPEAAADGTRDCERVWALRRRPIRRRCP
ncbi:MAG: helix-turn-helix transcriptional regulator [Solirubrobacterales bacterium]|nr:helix-turn-helix transcriptional regulator [Solirubrobacterales bacterium]